VNANGEVLVARRAKEPAKGTLDLPGGFCDCYESVEQGIAREIEEETGLKVKETNYLFSIPNIYSYSGMDIHTMDLFFRCTVEEGIPVPNDDVAELEWIAIDKLKSEEFGLISIRKGVEILKVLKNNKL
jgi:ADP-ribose pyrophosphatase YjhB (NUDIX family)